MFINKIFPILAVSLVAFVQPAFAESDPATAARQAEIDADQAQAKIDEVEQNEEGQIAADNADTAELQRDQAEINLARRERDNAIEREQEAHNAANNN